MPPTWAEMNGFFLADAFIKHIATFYEQFETEERFLIRAEHESPDALADRIRAGVRAGTFTVTPPKEASIREPA